MIRLVDLITNKILPRRLPRSLSSDALGIKPNLVVKMDIEGSELEVLTDLLVTGTLSKIDLLTIEYHSESFTRDDVRSAYLKGLEKAVDTINYLSQKLRLKDVINVQTLDDESYATVRFPLPECEIN